MVRIQNQKRDSHGKSRNGHGKVMEKYFVKSVETLTSNDIDENTVIGQGHKDRFVNRNKKD